MVNCSGELGDDDNHDDKAMTSHRGADTGSHWVNRPCRGGSVRELCDRGLRTE